MKIDLSLEITQQIITQLSEITQSRKNANLFGHMGTHLDLMNKQFDLEKSQLCGHIFDVSHITDREIQPEDIKLTNIQPNSFIMFYTGSLDKYGYPTTEYLGLKNPQLSYALIDQLIAKQVVYIGVDLAGAREGKEHFKVDQYCADHNIFIVENMANLKLLFEKTQGKYFDVTIYPLNLVDSTGLPCRVIAQI